MNPKAIPLVMITMGFLFFPTVYGMVRCLLALQAVGALRIMLNIDENIHFNFCLLQLVHLILTINLFCKKSNSKTHLILLPAFIEDPV